MLEHIFDKYNNAYNSTIKMNSPEEVLVISKIKNTVSWTYIIMNVNGEKVIENF